MSIADTTQLVIWLVTHADVAVFSTYKTGVKAGPDSRHSSETRCHRFTEAKLCWLSCKVCVAKTFLKLPCQ